MRVRHQLQALSFRRADGEHPPGEYDEKAGLHACSCTSPHFNDKWPGPACSTCTRSAATPRHTSVIRDRGEHHRHDDELCSADSSYARTAPTKSCTETAAGNYGKLRQVRAEHPRTSTAARTPPTPGWRLQGLQRGRQRYNYGKLRRDTAAASKTC